MAGISGSGIDRALYPNPYGDEKKMARAYNREAGGSGSAQGWNRETAMARLQHGDQQAAAYGDMFKQLALLAAYAKFQNQGQAAIPGQAVTSGSAQPMPGLQAPSMMQPRFPYHEPENY